MVKMKLNIKCLKYLTALKMTIKNKNGNTVFCLYNLSKSKIYDNIRNKKEHTNYQYKE